MFIIVASSVFSQRIATRSANRHYKAKRYYKAINQYEKLSTDTKTNPSQAIRIAHCYYEINDYERAYQRFSEVEPKEIQPEYLDKYAQTSVALSKYDIAIKIYEELASKRPDFYNRKIKSCLWAMQNDEIDWNLWFTSIDAQNAIPEFGIGFHNSECIYSSTTNSSQHKRSNKVLDTKENKMTNLYTTNFDCVFSEGRIFSKALSLPHHEGKASFTGDFSKMYFSATNDEEIAIFEAVLRRKDWEITKKLDFFGDNTSCAHPAINSTGDTLYFASNTTGGYGGKDLYYVVKERDKWSTPHNMGNKINTSEDELFPFISPTGQLFFSSNGHAGFGGFDIFFSKQNKDGWSEPQNLMKPYNSSKHDLSYIVAPFDTSLSMLVTNRERPYSTFSFYVVVNDYFNEAKWLELAGCKNKLEQKSNSQNDSIYSVRFAKSKFSNPQKMLVAYQTKRIYSNNNYIYTIGNFDEKKFACDLRRQAIDWGFTDSEVIMIVNGNINKKCNCNSLK